MMHYLGFQLLHPGFPKLVYDYTLHTVLLGITRVYTGKCVLFILVCGLFNYIVLSFKLTSIMKMYPSLYK